MPTDESPIVTSTSEDESNDEDDKYFMRKSLEVAERALEIGEVPVGCVLVLDQDHPAVVYKKKRQRKKASDRKQSLSPEERCGVVISHGANQVNATRDATRHAEIVAIDRLLTDGVSSDQLRLPQCVDRDTIKNLESSPKRSFCNSDQKGYHSMLDGKRDRLEDRWINDQSNPEHWTNSFGWRNNFEYDDKRENGQEEQCEAVSRELRAKDIFRHCQLYVTCEVSQKSAIPCHFKYIAAFFRSEVINPPSPLASTL